MNERVETVSDHGESELLKRIAERLGPERGRFIGDDTAVLPHVSDTLLFSTDVLVENVDFDLAYARGSDFAWKAIAVNVSDIGAMGGQPSHALVALTMPGSAPVAVFDDILDGLIQACDAYGVELAGGDISEGSEISLSVSIVGSPAGEPVLRSGARAGQAICVTGSLGGSAAGLTSLRRRAGGEHDADEQRELLERLAARHLRPDPPLKAARALADAGATAMMDVSDGLAVDLLRMMNASGTGCSVTLANVPVDPDAARLGTMLTGSVFDPVRAAVLGGEDFEILCTLDVARFDAARQAVARAGTTLTSIGVVTSGARTLGGRSLEEWKEEGWDHLRSP